MADDRDTAIRAVVALVPQVRARADEIEQNRSVPPDLFEQLARAGAFRLLLPDELGGYGCSLAELYDVGVKLSEADASTGWVVTQGATASAIYGLRYPPEMIRTMAADPLFNFTATGVVVNADIEQLDDGFGVSGRFSFATGCANATCFSAVCPVKLSPDTDPVAVTLVIPIDEVEIIDNWHTLGMRGTGSNDINITDVHVPAERAYVWGAPLASAEFTLSHVAIGTSFIAMAAAAVLVGIARRTLTEVEQVLVDKRLFMQQSPHVQSNSVQGDWARSTAEVDAADLLARSALDRMWTIAQSGRPLTLVERAEAHAALATASQLAATTTDRLCELATRDAMWSGSTLERCLRDARTQRMHASIHRGTIERCGAVMLGAVQDDRFV